ncbi:MAG: DUF177 domain-containing protein [Lachnospiraceae bacterium]|nr:DUF177 domain-containing protein [Butyrivibrio sp.]MCM1343383.1 DUF177 domain-containing protein [Muribaculaceae bacterium]MCM1410552.1 DUF177 domain-containing protein [Lachnospiraceae bacterium]
MLVNLSDVLTSEGMQVRESADLEMKGFESRTGSYEIIERSPVSFTFTNIEDGKARVEGGVRLRFRAECDRCLAEVPVALELNFDRVVAPSDAAAEEEIDDLSFMEGYHLNVETFVYNEIIGNWPSKILCREDCRGICPKCGQNLNIRDCGCDTFVPDPRMAAIQDIFNAGKEV